MSKNKQTLIVPVEHKPEGAALFQGDVNLNSYGDEMGDAFLDRGDVLDFGEVNLLNYTSEVISSKGDTEEGDTHRIHTGDVRSVNASKIGAAKVGQKLSKAGVPPQRVAATIVQARSAATFAREGARSGGKILEGDAVRILNPSNGIEIVQTGVLRTDARVAAGKVKWNMYQSMNQPYKRFVSSSVAINTATAFDMAQFVRQADVEFQASLIEIKVDASMLNKLSSSEIQVLIEIGTDTGGNFVPTATVYTCSIRYKSKDVSPSVIALLARQVDGEWYPVNVPIRQDSVTPANTQNVRVTLTGNVGDVATVSLLGTECDYGRQLMSSLTPF